MQENKFIHEIVFAIQYVHQKQTAIWINGLLADDMRIRLNGMSSGNIDTI